MTQQLNIIGGFYADEARPWTQQDICNYIPFRAEQAGTLSPVIAVDAPGLRPFVEIASNGGIRGMENVEGKLLVVAGTELYQISNTGVAIPRGTIPGTGLVSIGYNQAGIANEVLIGNGSAGYVYNTATLTLERVTDPAFPGTKAVDYLDSYLLGVEPLGRFWFHSDLADASSYNSLDRYEAETSPDRIVTLAVSNEEVVVFGQKTTDFFVNTGAATGTFQSKGVSMTVGCASANSVVKLDNTLFWLDNFGVFQRLNGYSPQPVSTRVIESAISGFDWSRCTATVYQDKGRKIVYWTFPDGLTLGYDVTTGMWHRREAYGLTRDRLSCIVNWNRKWLAGDYINGRIYELDWDYMLQVDQPHVRKVKTAPLTALRKRVALSYAELVFDTGGPETVPAAFPVQPESPTISGSLPDGDVGISWAGGTYTATGGTPPYVFTSRPGTVFPGNLGPMSSAGVVAAETPDTAGEGVNIPRVTDANGLHDELTDNFSIVAGNYWNPADSNTDLTLSNANRTATTSNTGDTFQKSRGFSAKSAGKWYFETQGVNQATLSDSCSVGLDPPTAALIDAVGSVAGSYCLQSNGYRNESGVFNATQIAPTLPGDNVIMVAYDADAGHIWYGVNGVWGFGGNPATGANPSSTGAVGPLLPAASQLGGGGGGSPIFSCTLSTTPTQCAYTPPTGFSRWYP